MVNQTAVTVTGYLGSDPKMVSGPDSAAPCCVFRVGSTKRYFSEREGKWKDSGTAWVTVKSYRGLARNVQDSMYRGDPVIVSGNLVSSSWKDKQGNPHTSLYIEAQSVGHDLSRGTTRFRKRVYDYAAQSTQEYRPRRGAVQEGVFERGAVTANATPAMVASSMGQSAGAAQFASSPGAVMFSDAFAGENAAAENIAAETGVLDNGELESGSPGDGFAKSGATDAEDFPEPDM